MRGQLFHCVGFVIIGIAIAASVGFARAPQSPAAPIEPIAALLSEVHALRLAMEQSATVGPRVQVTLARLGIQEQRTAQLSTMLDEVRRQLAQTALESQKISAEIEGIDKQTPQDESARRGLEYERAALKRKLATQALVEQQLRSRENDAAQLLSTEQARWIDLNARLDELERLLTPVR